MKALAFDFNGTMYMDTDKHRQAWDIFFQKYIGRPLEEEEFLHYACGPAIENIMRHFFPQVTDAARITAFAEEKEAIYRRLCREIVEDFDALPLDETLRKPRIGVVGEILVKYMPLANNHLVDLLEREGAEAVVPDLMDFLNYCVYNAGYKHEFLGGTWRSAKVGDLAVKAIARIRRPAIQALKASRRFDPPLPIAQVAEYAKPFLSVGNQYGEGWFLTGEMVELIHSGAPNIVCIQPFACLPNHVVGKGVIKLLRKTFPQANIVAVDYDPGASEVNQLNRIKLMLATARKNLTASAQTPDPVSLS